MEFFKVVEKRHSTRAFSDLPVEDDKLKRILEVANKAPSAGNLQGYEIYVVRQAAQKQALAGAAFNQEFIAEAPVILVFCANPSRSAVRYKERGEHLYSVQDATIACTYVMLAATAVGLSCVWVGAFDGDAVREAIGVSKELFPVALLPVGYAGQPPQPTSRRGLHDIVHEA